jgi:hypothetical protein
MASSVPPPPPHPYLDEIRQYADHLGLTVIPPKIDPSFATEARQWVKTQHLVAQRKVAILQDQLEEMRKDQQQKREKPLDALRHSSNPDRRVPRKDYASTILSPPPPRESTPPPPPVVAAASSVSNQSAEILASIASSSSQPPSPDEEQTDSEEEEEDEEMKATKTDKILIERIQQTAKHLYETAVAQKGAAKRFSVKYFVQAYRSLLPGPLSTKEFDSIIVECCPCTLDAVKKARHLMGLQGKTVAPSSSSGEGVTIDQEEEDHDDDDEPGPGSTVMPSIEAIKIAAIGLYEDDRASGQLSRDTGKPLDRHYVMACFKALQEPVATHVFDHHVAQASGLQHESIRQCRKRLGNQIVRVEGGDVVPKNSVEEEEAAS